MKGLRILFKIERGQNYIDKVRTAQEKPGKPGERDFSNKNQGKPGNSGNFLTIFTTSGKSQGILFSQTSLIK